MVGKGALIQQLSLDVARELNPRRRAAGANSEKQELAVAGRHLHDTRVGNVLQPIDCHRALSPLRGCSIASREWVR